MPVEYRCGKCGRIIIAGEEYEYGPGAMGLLPGVRCPYCGHKILYKVRTKSFRRIKAI